MGIMPDLFHKTPSFKADEKERAQAHRVCAAQSIQIKIIVLVTQL